MRAAAMKERPSVPLMRQTDGQNIYHTQMSRWLFSDPRYAGMNLDAKVAYTFLLNRFQPSQEPQKTRPCYKDLLLAVIADVNAQVAEREELLEATTRCSRLSFRPNIPYRSR